MIQLQKKLFLHKVVTVLTVIICVLLAFIYFKSCDRIKTIEHSSGVKEHKDSVIKAKILTEAKILKRQVDADGIQHVIADITDKTFPKSVLQNEEAIKGTFVDSVSKRLKIKTTQVTDLTVVVSTLRAEKVVLEKKIDSLKKEYYVYNDKFLNLKFTPEDTSTNTPALADFIYNGKLTTTQYTRQRIPLIGKKRTYIDIFPVDPRMRIDGIQKFSVEQKPNNFGLKLQLRSLYGVDSHRFYAGPGLSFDVGRLNFLAYMYYDFTTNRWLKSGGVAFNLLEL